ncbi:MAG TPA: hypothetical protein VIW03_08265 [Anaeromyxobacter sp.]
MPSRTTLAAAACSMLLLGGRAAPAADAIPADPPARPERPSRLMTIGRAYTVEAGGCESRNTHFHVTAIQPIDRTRADKSQVLAGVFFHGRELTGQSGWRNVGFSADGRSIEFDLYARGGGEIDSAGPGRSRCEGPSAARAVVDIEAWVFE